MLQDREYMRNRRPERGEGETSPGGMQCLFILIAVNVLAFLLFKSENFSLDPYEFSHGRVWQVLTAMFMHEDGWHLFFNMFTLYIFGQIIAPRLGATRFLSLYLTCGLGGNLIWLASNWNASIYLLGASGAVMGILMSAAMMAPDVQMFLLFIPFPVKLRTMAVVFFALEIFNQTTASNSGIAYLVHIGGFVVGYLYCILFLKSFVEWDPLEKLFGSSSKKHSSTRMPHGWKMSDGVEDDRERHTPPPSGPVTQRELDALLDKVSRAGINSLSEAEMDRLRQAREQMRSGR